MLRRLSIAPLRMPCRRLLQPLTRWLLPPRGTVQLIAQFCSDAVGRCAESVAFEVACGERHTSVALMGVCDYPRINMEPK